MKEIILVALLGIFSGICFAQITPIIQNQINQDQNQINNLTQSDANIKNRIAYLQNDIANQQIILPEAQAFDVQSNIQVSNVVTP